jgi:Zn-dependent protease with chaperone function
LLTWLVLPTLTLAGLAGEGLWGMLAFGAAGAAILATYGVLVAAAVERAALGARALPVTPPAAQELAVAAGIRRVIIYALPDRAGPRFSTASWGRRRAAVLIPQRWITQAGDLHPDAVGAVAHELAHVRAGDVLVRHVVGQLAALGGSLSLLSPVAVVWPELLAQLDLSELAFVVFLPVVSWLAATTYPSLMRRIELRADRRAVELCGAERLERSIRVLADDTHAWLFSTHPTTLERLRALTRVMETRRGTPAAERTRHLESTSV